MARKKKSKFKLAPKRQHPKPLVEKNVAPQAHAADEALPEPQPVPDHLQATADPEAAPTPPRVIEEAGEPSHEPMKLRLQSRVQDEYLDAAKGRIVTDAFAHMRLTGPAIVNKPNGKLLCVYLPGVLREEMDTHYPVLSAIRMLTDNRGLASGSARVKAGTTRTRTKPVMSGILGAMDPVGPMQYCRLTAYTAKNVENWASLAPLWQAIAGHFEEHVPGRFAAQMDYVRQTPPEWVIPGTPYTTITINNSYPTGLHTDSGDLDEGFSCLAVCRKGNYTGGVLTFPQYQIAADMQHGDLILMDAHEWHGNTRMFCECGEELSNGPCKVCKAERVSVVCYYRTAMTTCGSMAEEDQKKAAYGARRIDGKQPTEEQEMAADLAAASTV